MVGPPSSTRTGTVLGAGPGGGCSTIAQSHRPAAVGRHCNRSAGPHNSEVKQCNASRKSEIVIAGNCRPVNNDS
jgi:hypothetical protein